MSQDEILNILRSHKGRFFSRKELKPLVKCNEVNLVRNVSRLVKFAPFYGLKTKKGKHGKNFIRF